MKFNKRINCTTDLRTWSKNFDITNTVIRYWIHGKFEKEFTKCMFGYFRQLIDLGAGKWLVGIESTEESDKSRMLDFYPLDLLTFEIANEDQDGYGE